MSENQRQMTPEELVANGYPADLHTRPGAYEEYQQQKAVRGYGLRASDFNGHVPELSREERLDEAIAAHKREVKQARDKAQYVRQQRGHSWILHWCVLGIFTLWIVPIYYSFSPNHYWHI